MGKYKFRNGKPYRDYGYLDEDERYDYTFTPMPWELGNYYNNIITGIKIECRYNNLTGELDYLVTDRNGYMASCDTLDDVIKIMDRLIQEMLDEELIKAISNKFEEPN